MSVDRNKETAVAFLRRSFIDGDGAGAVGDLVGDSYVQHSPGSPDGIEAFLEFAGKVHSEHPGLELDIRRVLGDGDLVAVHMLVSGLAPVELAIVDIYRFDVQGRIVEHWDVMQEVPAEAANDNGMF